MPKNKHGSYYKPKKETIKELEKAGDTGVKQVNDLDAMEYEIQRAAEEAKGMTDNIRNIFKF